MKKAKMSYGKKAMKMSSKATSGKMAMAKGMKMSKGKKGMMKMSNMGPGISPYATTATNSAAKKAKKK